MRIPAQPTGTNSAKARNALIKRITLITVLANLFFYGLAGFALRQSWVRYQERATLQTQNLARAFARQIGAAIDKIDLTVVTVADEVEQQLARGGINPAVLNAFIARYRARVPALDGLRVTNGQGENAYGTDVNPAQLISVADRKYFQRLRSDPHAGLVISEPVVGRVSQKWSIIFARRINHPDGSFAGVAYGSMTLDHLRMTFAAVDLGSQGALTLRDENLALIMRYPPLPQIENELGKRNASPEMQAAVQAYPNGGTYFSTQAFDKVARLYSYCKITGHPFYLSAGLAPEEYLAAWQIDVIWVLALAALFMLGTLLSAGLVFRDWQRNERTIQALHQSEARLDFALQTIQAGAWELDLRNHTTHRTLLHDQIFGYATLLPEWTYEMFLDHVVPEDRPEVERKFRAATTAQTDWSFECRIRRADGEVRWILAEGSHQQDPAGQPVRLAGIVQDITDHKEAEAAVRQSEQRFQNLLQSVASVSVQGYAQDGTTQYWNQASEQIYGYTAQEAIGRNLLDLIIPPEMRSAVQAAIQQMAATGQPIPPGELSLMRKDGSRVAVYSSHAIVQFPGRPPELFCIDIDLTAYKQAEAALQLSEEKFRAIANYTVGWESWFGPDGKYLWVNPGVERMTGYSAEEILALPDYFATLVAAEDRAEVMNRMAGALQGSRGEDFEFRYRHKDGSKRWLSVAWQPIYDSQGKPLGVRTSGRDITDRKRVEAALQESEQKFRLLFKHLVVGFALHEIICDPAGRPCDYRFLTINPAFEKLTGLKAADLIGRTMQEVLPANEPVWLERYGAVALGGEPVHFEQFAAALGRHFSVSAYCPAPGQFATIVSDITDRITAEEELRLQGGALRAAANAIVITDPQGKVVWGNPAFTALTGYELAEVCGQTLRILKSGQQDKAFYQGLWDTIQRGEVWAGELVNKRKDGRLYTEEMIITPVQNPAGEVTHFIAIKQDITARRVAEQQVQDSNRQLSVALAELRQTQRQIIQEEKLRGLGQMASGIAHDFNNALSPIIGFSELLLKHPDKLADHAQVLKWLKSIHTSATDAAHVVRRIREFGRQHLGSDGILPVDLAQLVPQTVELTASRWRNQAQAGGRTIQVVTELAPVPQIIGEEFALRELLINLIFNAVDALTGDGTITLGLAAEEGGVRLWVSDTGAGMSAEQQKHCFEPFFTTKSETGSGLGLAMVHSIVQRHHGTIAVASQLGQGTTITVRFPTQQAAVLKPSLLEEVPPLTKPLRVLVVDDQALLRDIVAECLAADHHPVATAVNAREGLAHLKTAGPFDLVITDLAMPEMNGEQLAAVIEKDYPGLPVVLMTGFGDLMKADGKMPPHVRAILSKPITQAGLRAVLFKVFPQFA